MVNVGRILVLCLCLLAGVPFAFAQGENLFLLKVQGGEYFQYCAPGVDGLVHTFEICVYNPVNPSFEGGTSRPVSLVSGFECRLQLESATGAIQIVGLEFPVPTINVGDTTNIVAGFSEPVAVGAEGYAVLCSVDFVFVEFESPAGSAGPVSGRRSPTECDGEQGAVFLSPTLVPSISQKMAFVDAEDGSDPLVAAQPVWGWDYPSYIVTDGVVSVESAPWGSVKVQYK